jgi:uncharacterized membrane protein
MPVFLSGLPLHALIVHAVVVLVPLAVVGTVTIAVWPTARRRYGWLVIGLTAVATASIPIAMDSGDGLKDRLVPTDLIEQHAHLGDELLVFVIGLLVVSTALVWLDRRRQVGEPSRAKAIAIVLSVLTVAFAAVSAVQVVRIGDSGARAAWSSVQYTAPNQPR